MREKPTWRIPVGILGLCCVLLVYALVVARYVPELTEGWHIAAQTLLYIALGLVWLLPLRNFLIWMETGRWG